MHGGKIAALFAAFWVVAAVLGASPSNAEDAEQPGWGYDLSHDLMSPYCPGRTLAECPSPAAEELRNWIVHQEESGESKSEVEALLFERFGDEIRQAPRVEGFGLTAYGLPILAFLSGAGVLVLFFRRQIRPLTGPPSGSESAPGPGADRPIPATESELERRFREELGE